jgi:tetratricopeptide (TPR) repeat protein
LKPMTRHLLPGEIIEAASRQLATAAALEHLSTCAECKGKIEEYRSARMALVPARATQNSEPGPDCPPLERLAAYAAGQQDSDTAGHIANCDRCAWIVRDALEEDTEPAPRRLRRSNRLVVFWAAVGLASIAVAGFFILRAPSQTPLATEARSDSAINISEELARAYTETRPFDYRLNDAGYSAVHPGAASDHSGYVAAAERAIDRRLHADRGDAEAIAFEGRLNLLLGRYEKAIAGLTRVVNEWPDDPTPRRDLACAYALRAAREERPADYETAAAMLRQVLEKRPDNVAALFNLALVEERMFDAATAAELWKRFISTRPAGGWGQEAARHLAALERVGK